MHLRPNKQFGAIMIAAIAAALSGCATESSQTLAVPVVAVAQTPYAGKPIAISIGKFDNRSAYMRGIFSDGIDRLGGQARTILTTRLQQSGRFNVLDRDNLYQYTYTADYTQRIPVRSLFKRSFYLGASLTHTGD